MFIKINIFKRTFMFEMLIRKQRTKQMVNGYTNRCKDGKYICFLDYDDMDYEWVIAELEALQVFFNLDKFYVFESSENHYHAVCFDKLTLSNYLKVLKNSSVDTNYINVPLHFGKKIWTLRLSDKGDKNIRFCGCIMPKKEGYRQQSRPHIDLVNNLFEDVRITSNKSDELNELVLSRYPL